MAKKSSKSKSGSRKNTAPSGGFGKGQVTAIFIFFISLLLFLFSIFKGENFWNTIHSFLLGSFGFIAFPLFILICYISIRISFHKFSGRVRMRILGESAFLFLLATVVNVFSFETGFGYGEFLLLVYDNGVKGGGILGGFLAYPFASLFGITGAAIILILMMALVFLLTTGITLMQVVRAVSKPAGRIKEDTKRIFEKKRQNNELRKKEYDISIEGMPEYPVNTSEKTDLATKKKRVVELYNDTAQPEDPEDEPCVEEPEQEKKMQQDLDDIIKRVQDAEPPSKPQPIAEKPTAGIQVSSAAADEYHYPPITLLEENPSPDNFDIGDELKQNAELLVDTLRSFGVETRIINISRGPSVTRYELQPAAGVKISKITNLADDIALNLATVGVRIEAPIPNKAAVGIEVPNKSIASVRLREIISTKKFEEAKSKLTVAVGKDIAGNVVTADLAKMPHLLIAGTTGSGKSVCINSFILSVLYKASPDEVKLLMIDPKVVELEVYNGLPHLLVPVVTDPKKASGALGWAVTEMEKRYKLFGECKVRDIKSYNEFAKTHEEFSPMPQILIVVDELNDLMMVAPGEVEDSICRLAQKARAAGMNLVIATQRPSVDVLTGLIKANVPSRIALKVANRFDSGTIIDTIGAEKLLGRGDMLFYPVGMAKPLRVQGCWVSDDEIKRVVNYIIGDEKSEYSEEIADEIDRHAAEAGKGKKSLQREDAASGEMEDEMLPNAIEVVVEAGIASTSLLQRKLKLGYARAARIVDMMEERGIVGPFEGSKPRKVLISKQQWMEMRMNGTDEENE